MSKSRLIVTGLLCAVVGLASARAYGPAGQGKNAKGKGRKRQAAELRSAERSSNAKPIRRSPRFVDTSRLATPENRWLHDMLSKPIPPLDFPGEVPLSEVLEVISTYYTVTYGAGAADGGGDFRMAIYPEYAELDLEGITSLEDVTVRDIGFEGIQLRNALKLIFDQTTDPELTYVIKNQVMMVTTLAKAESEDNFVTRVYNAGELADLDYGLFPIVFDDFVQPPKESDRGRGVGYFSVPVSSGTATSNSAATAFDANPSPKAAERPRASVKPCLATFVIGMTSPAKWFFTDGEGGAIQQVGHVLVVRQTPAVHRQIVLLLNVLDQAENGDLE